MDLEVQKIESLYNQKFSAFIQPMHELSRNSEDNVELVQSNVNGYNFDSIKNSLYTTAPTPTSVDALYFNKVIAFIEFKSGLKPKGKSNSEYKKNCEDSARDSIMAHRFFMSLHPEQTINISAIKTLFVVVINSSAKGKASAAYANALAGRSDLETNFKQRLKRKFTGKDFLGQDTFYSDVDVWNDINFDVKIAQI